MSNLETVLVRLPNRVLSDAPEISVVNVGFGVNVYKHTLSKETCYQYITTLNEELDGSGLYSWEASEPERNAQYFSTTEEMFSAKSKDTAVLKELHDSIFDRVKQCINDYASSWKISISHYDPLSFIKYSHPYNNYDYHIDDNPDIPRTVSAVVYLNDNYDGGELSFSRLDGLTIKPGAGDIVVFPSAYLYEHEAKPVLRGTKYAVAVFTHYKKRA